MEIRIGGNTRVSGKPLHLKYFASNKADAYDKAVYELIPEKHGTYPYSAWVYSVTYNNGNQKFFNTCEGLAY